ncbi:MAG: SemiSWEET family transporter [archaeon]
MWSFVALLAVILTNLGLLSQIIRGFRTKKLDDLSYWMMALLDIGIFCWLVYGLHIKDWFIIGANIIGVAFISMLLTMKYIFSE